MNRSGSMTRYDVMNYLIRKNNYNSYLEIGTQHRNGCFNHIKCASKVCIDPDPNAKADFILTSDDFFNQNKNQFDIIFIDGLHHADQVYKDILNSLRVLKEGGIIVCHDMIPSSFEAQVVPRITKHWNGDCWKAFVQLRTERADLEMRVIQTDCGLGVIRKGAQELLNIDQNFNYSLFEPNRKEWLNAIEVEEFLKLY